MGFFSPSPVYLFLATLVMASLTPLTPADLSDIQISLFLRTETLPESQYYPLLLIIKAGVTFGWTKNCTGSNVPITVIDVGAKAPTLASWNGIFL